MRLVAPFLLLAAAVTAQSPLTTTFANNNNGAVGGAVYYDLNITNPAGITVTQIDINTNSAAGTVGSLSVYVYGPGGTWVGNTTNPALWQLVSGGNLVSAGPGQPTTVVLNPPIPLPGGTQGGCCLVANGVSHTYTTGTAPFPLVYSNSDLTLSAGGASNVPFVGAPFSPRVFNGNHHYVVGSTGTLGTNTSTGQGCYRRYASFYENFATAAAVDLSGTCITLDPLATGGYTVSPTGPGYQPPGPAATTVPLTDDSQAAVGTLGLVVGSNGWVAFGAGNSNAFTPSAATALSNPSTALYFWHDLNPAIPGSGQVWYEETLFPGGGTAIITYDGVWDFGGTGPANANNIRIVITCQGLSWTIEIEINLISGQGNGWLFGFSPGGASQDPGNLDLSAALGGGATFSIAGADVLPLALSATTRPVTGTNWNLAVSNGGGLADLVILGLSDPMIPDLFFLGLPGCGLRANLDLISVGSTFSVGLPNNPTLVGAHLYANGASFAPGVNPFGAITSNGIDGMIGDL